MLADWICPLIFGGTGHVDRSWSHQCDQRMLIDRQFIFSIVVFRKLVTEPMWKNGVDSFHRFANAATLNRRAAATGIIADDDFKTLVRRSSPQRRLAQS